MNVSTLISNLELFLKTHGDLPVKVYADHGQHHFTATQVELAATEELEAWMSEPLNLEDAEESHAKVCEVS